MILILLSGCKIYLGSVVVVGKEAVEEEVAAAEVAGEGKRTRTSGPRARSWGDWCKRYAFL